MTGFVTYDDSFPHGTITGYRAGCRGSACPADVSCNTVHIRYVGDYAFKKMIDAGTPAGVIVAAEEREAAEVRARDKAANRAARAAERAPKVKKPKKPRVPRERKPRPAPVPRVRKATFAEVHADRIRELAGAGKTDRVIADTLGCHPHTIILARKNLGVTAGAGRLTADPVLIATVREKHAAGWSDIRIAVETGVSRHTIGNMRKMLNLPAVAPVRKERARSTRVTLITQHAEEVKRLHGEGLSDVEIAERTGLTKSGAYRIRTHLGLPAATQYARAKNGERGPVVRDLHAKGFTDRQVGERLGVTRLEAGRVRRSLGLPANRVVS